MSNIEGYDPTSTWLSDVKHDNSIDYFFTQRKIVEFEEYMDDNLNRKKTKKNVTINFLAITFPNNQFKNKQNLEIDIEIWGDEKYHYSGKIINKQGDHPHLLLQLDDDKELFVKLIYFEISEHEKKFLKTFTNFIPIIKRYQKIPEN